MGTYALSAGYYDAFYKRAQQVWANMTLKEIVENSRCFFMDIAVNNIKTNLLYNLHIFFLAFLGYHRCGP